MPNTKISNLTSAGTLTGTEVAPIVQSSNTVKVSTQDIANLALPSQTGNANKYLQTNGTVASWDAVNISTADITGTLPIANGGTGQTTANTAINALLPSQGGNSGKYLTTNGTDTSWGTVSLGKQTVILRITTNGAGAVGFTQIQGITGVTWSAFIVGNSILVSPSPNVLTFNTVASGSTTISSGGAVLICVPEALGGSSQTFSFYNTSNTIVNMGTTATASGQYSVFTITIN